MAGYKRQREPDIEFEGKVEHSTSRAHLVTGAIVSHLDGEYWVPKSQISFMGDKDINGERTFVVSGWWWGGKAPTEELDGKA